MNITIEKHNILAQIAANNVEKTILNSINTKGKANIVLATGNSQLLFLKELRKKLIPWEKVVIFHLDEYIGLKENHHSSFRKYLIDNIIKHITPKQFHPIKADTENLEEEINNYTNLLNENPIDLACIGIGENGHLAFNDPGVANFNDIKSIKVVELDNECRMQQFNEGWFDSIDTVPRTALTLTISAIMAAKHISCFVPDERKALAVKNSLEGKINLSCPASILRNHSSVKLYLDPPSASMLSN